MDPDAIRLAVEICVGPFVGVVGWLLRRVITDSQEQDKVNAAKFAILEKDLADYKLHVATTHPTQDHLSKAIDGFTNSVRELFGKLDGIQGEIKHMSDSFRDKLESKADRRQL